jgi:hypothetical protein
MRKLSQTTLLSSLWKSEAFYAALRNGGHALAAAEIIQCQNK